jgi:excisionase family DNA binding protein
MAMAINMQEVCTTKEAAEIIGIHETLVRRYCQQARISAKQVGKQWILDRTDVEKFAKKDRPYGNPNLLRSTKKRKGKK